MKRYTSKTLKIIAGLYLGFVFSHLLFAAILFNISADSCLSILLSPSYYFIAVVAMIAGYGLWEMRRWAWYVFIASNILIIYENAVITHDYGASAHKMLAFIASLAIVVWLIFRVAREVRVPYFFPKIRWWESNPRYRLSVPAMILKESESSIPIDSSPVVPGALIDGQILDLSIGGCFVKLKSDLPLDQAIYLKFTVFGNLLELPGTVVWRTTSTVTHPRGAGVKFGRLDRTQRRALKLVNRRLKKIAQFYRRSRYLLNQDEFLKRLTEIESESLVSNKRTKSKA